MSARHRRCPTPHKVVYETKADALRALRGMKGGALRAYKCRAHWHTTSSPARRRR